MPQYYDSQGYEASDMQRYHAGVDHSTTYTPKGVLALGGRVTRLRLLTDPGFPFLDVSYCHATLADGTVVPVELPFDQIPRVRAIPFIVEQAKREGFNARDLGLLDRSNWSVLY